MEQKMAKPIVTNLRQVALYAPNPDKLAEFYETVLGLHVIAQSQLNAENVHSSIFLSKQPVAVHHQVAIVDNPDVQHTAFEVVSLTDLKTCYELIVERDLQIRWVLNHGVSLAFYFHDPAGNLIQLYWSTGEVCPQPYGYPIDLTQPEAVLRKAVADLVAQLKLAKGGDDGIKERDD
jgi:catechol-2,3-dioxygenase